MGNKGAVSVEPEMSNTPTGALYLDGFESTLHKVKERG